MSNAAHLLVRDTSGSTREVEINHFPFMIGRQSESDLVLLDSRISRNHARILQDSQGFLIEDSESRHGTYVNGERVTTCRLKGGDQISLGVADGYSLCFVMQEPELPELLEKLEKVAESPAPKLQHLALLLQMAHTLVRAPALEEVLTVLVDAALSLTGAERGLLFLRGDDGKLQLRLCRAQGGAYLPGSPEDYSETVVQRVAETGREELILEEGMTGRTAQETRTFQGGIRGVVAVPLQKMPVLDAGGETMSGTTPELLGVLYLDSRSRATSLTGLDRQVLQTLAVEGATVIENARLLRLSRDQERMQHELSLARNIQQSLLPRRLPTSDYFEVEASSVPSRTIGGDYYDLISLPGGRYGFGVADVSGKGLPAAMMAATLQGAFGAVAAGDLRLAEVFGRVNAFLCERTPPEMFATMFYGVLSRTGAFDYVSAGHNPPFLLRRDEVIELREPANPPMGFFPGVAYEASTIQLAPGDFVVIFSDGLPEALDLSDEFFGEARLKNLLAECPTRTATGISDHVLEGVRKFVGSAPASDDLTLLTIGYNPPS
jgi:sigma-B regulation protein RsbU (phosphoserine phosphatase)